MKMEIGRLPRHQVAGTGVCAFLGIHMHVLVGGGHGIRAESRQIILEGQDDKIAGVYAKSRRLCPVVIEITVTSRSVALPGVVNRKFNFQHTIVAVQIRRFSHNATRQGARASVRRAARMEGQKRLTQTQT
jgi:hypothetical protein